jgi:hypothetical protein
LIGHEFTLLDVTGSLRAMLAFGVVLLVPGHCVGWATNLLGFRQRAAVQQLSWSVAISFAVSPIAAVMLGKYGSAGLGWWMAMAYVAVSLVLSYRTLRQGKDHWFRWSRVAGLVLAIVWVAFVLLELVDVQVGRHLGLSVTVFDHSLRTAFVDAVMRTGVPPANPLFWPGHAVAMRYYYFWYVLTAAVAKLAGVTARQAMIASVVWAGFGLAAIVGLYCRHFLASVEDTRGRWPRRAIALGLLAVTGLDVLPAVVKAAIHMPADGDMEWWSSDQVTSWMDSLLWVPHHIAGLVCCLFGFLLVWMSKGPGIWQRCWCGLIAGIAFASAFGLSTWVAVAFAMAMLAWLLWVLAWETESRSRLPVLIGAGLVATLVLVPYLQELRGAPADASVAGSASHLLRFGIRRIIDRDALLSVPWIAGWAQVHPRLEDSVVGLVLLVPGYFAELGFFGLVLVVALRAMRRSAVDESIRTAIFLAGVVLLAATFLRSALVDNNDFGFRSILISQFFLLLLAVRWCEGGFGATGRSLRVAMVTMLWIGVAGTVYQAAGLRLYLPVQDRGANPDFYGLSERALALRLGFEEMDRVVPKEAVVQYDTPGSGEFVRYATILELRRQMASGSPGCGVPFGGNASECDGVEQGIARLYTPGLSVAQARESCGSLGIGYLVATRWDQVWNDSGGWVWELPAAVSTGDVRVVACTEGAK